ncbi:MAG: alpha/beta hydrolase [Bacteroidia bacterium]
MTAFTSFIFLGIIAYLIIYCCTYWLQDYFIFRPKHLAKTHTYHFAQKFEEIWWDTEEGGKINGLWFTCEAPKGLILYFHGNADNLERWGKHAQEFLQHNFDVVMMDYRGFGKSSGVKSEALFHEDALTIYEWAAKHYSTEKIIPMGRSIGSGMACQLAATVQPPFLILETPFYSMPSLFYSYYAFLPVIFSFKYKFRNDLALLKTNCPILIFHGTYDYVVPYFHAKKLARLLGERATLITLPRGFHKGLGAFPLYQQKLKEALEGVN